MLDDDEWVINGQKIWTTTWWGRYMFLAARTDPDAKPAHAGISMFIVPMDAPGITVKPATTMYDGSFANIFYDDVRIPAENIVGPAGGGWKVLTDALANERGTVGGGIVLHGVPAWQQAVQDWASGRGGLTSALAPALAGALLGMAVGAALLALLTLWQRRGGAARN